MTTQDWEILTSYVESVGSTSKTFSFNKPQSFVKVTNKGKANLNYTIGTKTGALNPGESISVSETISSYTLSSASGTLPFEVLAKEDGTEKEEKSTDVTSQINDLNAQLAHIANVPDDQFSPKSMQTTSTKAKPIVVFTFDDGYETDITVMKPLFDEFGFKATTYVIPGKLGGTLEGYKLMTKEQFKEIYNAGWEIGSHTYTHIQTTAVSLEKVEQEFVDSKKALKLMGFECNNIAYPYGSSNNQVRRLALEHYRTATSFRAAQFNDVIPTITMPINKENLGRISMGTFFETPTTKYPVTNTFNEFYKVFVDDVIANNRLVIFALHSAPMVGDTVQMGYLRDTLAYCQAQGVSVLTLNEALEYYDNLIDIKLYKEDASIAQRFVIGGDGTSSGLTVEITLDPANYTASTLPEKYPIGLSKLDFVGVIKGFPYDSNCLVYTERPTIYVDTVRQYCYRKWDNRVAYRTAKQDGTWTEWNINLPYTELKIADYTASTLPDKYPYGTSVLDVHGVVKGFPYDNYCMVYTERPVFSYADTVRQTCYSKWGNKIAIRTSKQDGSWTNWLRIGENSGITANRTQNSIAGQFYFDTTLGKPIWYNGTAWVDATGTVV